MKISDLLSSTAALIGSLCAVSMVFGLSMAGQSDPPKSGQEAKPLLVVETTPALPGKSFNLGVHFDIKKAWHLYWPGQNDSGQPPEFKLTLPEGWKAGPAEWPAPVRHRLDGDILDHVYFDHLTIIIPVEVPADAKPGRQRIAADLSWVVCNEGCALGSASVITEFDVADAASKAVPTPEAPLFAEARKRHPKPLLKGDPQIQVGVADGKLDILAKGARKICFYPSADSVPASDLLAQGETKGERLSLTLDGSSKQKAVKGILEVVNPPSKSGEPLAAELYAIEVPIP